MEDEELEGMRGEPQSNLERIETPKGKVLKQRESDTQNPDPTITSSGGPGDTGTSQDIETLGCLEPVTMSLQQCSPL